MTPLNDYVLLQKIEKPKKPGALILTIDTDLNEPEYLILGVGADCDKDTNLVVKVNDIVYMRPFGGRNIKIDDKDYIIAKYEELIGVKNG